MMSRPEGLERGPESPLPDIILPAAFSPGGCSLPAQLPTTLVKSQHSPTSSEGTAQLTGPSLVWHLKKAAVTREQMEQLEPVTHDTVL